MTSFVRFVLAVLLVSAISAARAEENISADVAKAMVDKGEILPLQQILKLHEAALEGRIVEVELERERGRLIYEIKVLPTQGRYRKIQIDAANGELVVRR